MKFDWKTCIRVGISTVLVYLCIHYWDSFAKFVKLAFVAAAPLIIGSAFAYVLNILMRFYESHYFPKSDKNKLLFKPILRPSNRHFRYSGPITDVTIPVPTHPLLRHIPHQLSPPATRMSPSDSDSGSSDCAHHFPTTPLHAASEARYTSAVSSNPETVRHSSGTPAADP